MASPKHNRRAKGKGTEQVSAGPRGGRNNEAGSEYRARVAAWFAVHGLARQPIALLGLTNANLYPISIQLEANAAVDDILCLLADGSKLMLQAKRTCLDQTKLKEALAQFVRAIGAGQIGENDHLVLASENLSVKYRKVANDLLKAERDGLTEELIELDTIAQEMGLDEPQRKKLFRCLKVLPLQLMESHFSEYQNAVLHLQKCVISHHAAEVAFRTLTDSLRQLAIGGDVSGPEDWLGALRSASVELLPEMGSSARERARLQNYRSFMSSAMNVIPLSLMHSSLKPFVRPNLIDTIRGSSTKLIDALKLGKRMVLVGLPGSGKSLAATQLAAYLASDINAPVPVLFDFKRLRAEQKQSPVIDLFAHLIEGLKEVCPEAPAELAAQLLELASKGDAVLIFDGLDECRGKMGQASDAVSKLLGSSDTPVVLTTRVTGLQAAEKLDLPVVELSPPENFGETLRLLLAHVQESLRGKRQPGQVGSNPLLTDALARDGRFSLSKVPLLGVLATIIVAVTGNSSAENSLISILDTAVKNCLIFWEISGREFPDAYNIHRVHLPQLLLSSYSAVATALIDGRTQVTEIELHLAQLLRSDWGIPPAVAKLVAASLVDFWDQEMGIFIKERGHIIPRSRLFLDYAEARSLSATAADRWAMISRDTDPDVLQIAAGLNPAFKDFLVDQASSDSNHRLSNVILDAYQLKFLQLSDGQLGQLLEVSINGANAEMLEPSPNALIAVRHTVERVLLLREAGASLFSRQLAGVECLVPPKERAIARQLLLVGHLETSKGAVPLPRAQDIEAALRDALSLEQEPERIVSPRHIYKLVVWACENVINLEKEFIELITRVASRAGNPQVMDLEVRLNSKGLELYYPDEMKGARPNFEHLRGLNIWQGMIDYYQFLSRLSPPSPASRFQIWSLEELHILDHWLRLGELGPFSLTKIIKKYPNQTELLLRSSVDLLGLHLKVIVVLARRAAQLLSDKKISSSIGPLFEGPLRPPVLRQLSKNIDQLTELLFAEDSWIFAIARKLLKYAPPGSLALQARIGQLSNPVRADAVCLMLENQNDTTEQLLLDLLASADSRVQAGAAQYLASSENRSSFPQAMARVGDHPDYTVKDTYYLALPFSIRDQNAAFLISHPCGFWTCEACCLRNDMGLDECTKCKGHRSIYLQNLIQQKAILPDASRHPEWNELNDPYEDLERFNVKSAGSYLV